MGHVEHDVIVATTWNDELAVELAAFAESLGCEVLGPSEPRTNQYRTVVVCPDGSKSGWMESDVGDERRARVRAWLQSKCYADGSSAIEWFEACFGSDRRGCNVESVVEVTHHAWKRAAGDLALALCIAALMVAGLLA